MIPLECTEGEPPNLTVLLIPLPPITAALRRVFLHLCHIPKPSLAPNKTAD